MKITVYTINDCKFSQAEKEYLKKNNVEFEEKNLETNRDFLTEMLAVSNNFAGTPVTKIEKDSGESVVMKGFTQEEFDKALGITSNTTAQTAQTAAVAASSTDMKQEQPAEADAKPEETTPAEPTAQPAAEPTPAAPAETTTPEANKTPAPIAVESLSQDDSNSVTPSNDMPAPQPVEPVTPAAPTSNDSIGPISLDGAQTEGKPAEPAAEPTPAAPAETTTPETQPTEATAPAAQPQQPAAAQQPGSDALNSVLQNLQNQVNSAAPAQDGQKQQ